MRKRLYLVTAAMLLAALPPLLAGLPDQETSVRSAATNALQQR